MKELTTLVLYLGVLALAAWPLSKLVTPLFEGIVPHRKLAGLDRGLLSAFGLRKAPGQNASSWVGALMVFSTVEIVVVFLVQVFQDKLPLNPQAFPGVPWDLALNTAVSFVTNTNWQNYAGESTLGPLTQMLALGVQNFLSAACGFAVLCALVRGIVRKESADLGNFWVDVVRFTFYVLLPLSIVYALFLASQGVVQTLTASLTVTGLGGADQSLALGPVASQEAIKMLGTNGGGYFSANSAHPFENPNGFTNFVQMVSMFLIPAASVFAFGRFVKDQRQGWSLAVVMTVFFVAAVGAAWGAESSFAGGLGNMEGKETRFGIFPSVLFGSITTSTSTGAVIAMHDSFTALGGLVPLALMQLGEVVFGGVGSGLQGMLLMVLLTVFVGGLLVGRTPEYLGKKIEPRDMALISLAILVTPLVTLIGTAAGVLWPDAVKSLGNPGAHGFSEILYAYTSAANNNGSAFGGLSGNTPFFNLTLAVTMFLGRFGVMVPVLFLAGSLGRKRSMALNVGTLPTHTVTFGVLLVFFLILVAALNFIPAWALGPVAEALGGAS
jgi:K+-transporting ATPase ATPase A chain